jgi:dTDP-4-dehydrorhamnose reductase
MKILLTGGNGQVGFELARSLQGLGQVYAPLRGQFDLADLDQIRTVVRDYQPDLIINPAAYTAVDKAESEPELAMLVNAEAPGVLAEEAARLGAALIHFSTDYVFDGSQGTAYAETDPTNPVSVYGKTKLAGEQAISASDCAHLILRTSWVYGLRGKNFLLTMLRLAGERDQLRVVADQIGAPTWSRTLAEVTAHLVAQARAGHLSGDLAGRAAHWHDWWQQHGGVYHCTAQGSTSWHGFTEAIVKQALPEKAVTVTPIASHEYPTPARRPANSRLSCARFMAHFCDLPDWQEALRLCLQA